MFRLDPATGRLAAVVSAMVRRNGLAFSPDERTLSVAETSATPVPDLAAVIRTFSVEGERLCPGRDFAVSEAGFFDGFRLDRHGNLWTSSAHAVRAYAPDGTQIGRIRIAEIVSNLCFGGVKRNRLFITARTLLDALDLNTHPPGW